MFESLRRWTGDGRRPTQLPLDLTLAAMDEGGVAVAMLSAWHGPEGALISNEEVAGCVAEAPGACTASRR